MKSNYDMTPIHKRYDNTWKGGGKGYDDTVRYQNKGYENKGYENKLDMSPRYSNPGYSNIGYANLLDTSVQYRPDPTYTLPRYRTVQQDSEKKYTFPHIMRKFNDIVHEQAKSGADLVGVSNLNDNQIKEMKYEMYFYISKYFLILLAVSIIGGGLILTLNSLFLKIVVFLLTIGLYSLAIVANLSVLIDGQKNIHFEIGMVTFNIYENYAAPWRGFVKFFLIYIALWYLTFLFPSAIDYPFLLESFKYFNVLYVPASWVIDYTDFTLFDFFVLLIIGLLIAFWSFIYLKKVDEEMERERRERLNDIYYKSGKFELIENAKREVFGD